MNVAWSDEQLKACLSEAADVSKEHPVVISDFIEGTVKIKCTESENMDSLSPLQSMTI